MFGGGIDGREASHAEIQMRSERRLTGTPFVTRDRAALSRQKIYYAHVLFSL